MSNKASYDRLWRIKIIKCFKRIIMASIFTAITLGGSVVSPNLLPYGSWFNDYFRLTRANRIAEHRKSPLDITIVTVGEHFISQLSYRSPVDRCMLATGISSIMTLNPKVVGVDLLFDNNTEKHKDDLLKKEIQNYQDKLVVAVNTTEYANIDMPDAKQTENWFLPNKKNQASALLIKDSDFIVRNAMVEDDGVPTFATRLIQMYDKSNINWNIEKMFQIDWLATNSGKDDTFSIIPFELFLEPSVNKNCAVNLALPAVSRKEFIRPQIENKIVIIGVDLEREDRHLTPFDSIWHERETLSGVEIHANIAQQLIDGRYIANLKGVITFGILVLIFYYLSCQISANTQLKNSKKIMAMNNTQVKGQKCHGV